MSRSAVEVQQHCLCSLFDDGHRDVVPGEGADGLGGFPERVSGQLGGATLAEVAAQPAIVACHDIKVKVNYLP